MEEARAGVLRREQCHMQQWIGLSLPVQGRPSPYGESDVAVEAQESALRVPGAAQLHGIKVPGNQGLQLWIVSFFNCIDLHFAAR
jgi:hypothetical protein